MTSPGDVLPRPGAAGTGSRAGRRPDLWGRGLSARRARSAAPGSTSPCRWAGKWGPCPATVGATVYRIAQEALTNAAKHAPHKAVSVSLARRDDNVELTIDSAGAPGHGTGMGLTSMKERARVVAEGHDLSRVLTKLGAANRVQVAILARDAGLA